MNQTMVELKAMYVKIEKENVRLAELASHANEFYNFIKRHDLHQKEKILAGVIHTHKQRAELQGAIPRIVQTMHSHARMYKTCEELVEDYRVIRLSLAK
jgi:hypothetical protein